MMKTPKVTPWFPASVNPVRAGAYELNDLPYPYHYWDGEKWLCIAEKRPEHIKQSEIDSGEVMLSSRYIKNHSWRGLAEKPKGAKP